MTMPLLQLVEVRPGFPFRSSIIEDAAGDALVVQLKDVSRESGPDWSQLTRTRLSARKPFPFLQDDDILLPIRGNSYLAVHLAKVPEPAVAALHFFVLRADKKRILPAFLVWQLNYGPVQEYFRQVRAGSVQQGLRRADVEQIPVVVPPLEQQEYFVALAAISAATRIFFVNRSPTRTTCCTGWPHPCMHRKGRTHERARYRHQSGRDQ